MTIDPVALAIIRLIPTEIGQAEAIHDAQQIEEAMKEVLL
jgi:hypothetical protein